MGPGTYPWIRSPGPQVEDQDQVQVQEAMETHAGIEAQVRRAGERIALAQMGSGTYP